MDRAARERGEHNSENVVTRARRCEIVQLSLCLISENFSISFGTFGYMPLSVVDHVFMEFSLNLFV